MVCIPSNSEQLFNRYDHSRKIPGFKWTYDVTVDTIKWLIEFKYTKQYWKKHEEFCKYLSNDTLLEQYVTNVLRKKDTVSQIFSDNSI